MTDTSVVTARSLSRAGSLPQWPG